MCSSDLAGRGCHFRSQLALRVQLCVILSLACQHPLTLLCVSARAVNVVRSSSTCVVPLSPMAELATGLIVPLIYFAMLGLVCVRNAADSN